MTKPTAMDRARAYCENWGIRIDIRDNVGLTHEGPGLFSLHWPSRTIIMPSDQDAPKVGSDAMYLLHEASHVLVGEDPQKINETQSAMLALDFVANRHLRLGCWRWWMDEFGAQLNGTEHDGIEWPLLPGRVRRKLLSASLDQAVALGLLAPNWKPTFNQAAWRPRLPEHA